MARARALGGRRLDELAADHGLALPPSTRQGKGFVGRLVERALGAPADARPGPDFEALGVELKTLPIDARGRVRESTFVCGVGAAAAELEWERSPVRAKLQRVLFVLIEADRGLAFGARRVGAAFFWSPDRTREAILKADWEEIAGRIAVGEIEHLDARVGRALQLRPKGANAQARTRAYDGDGAPFLGPVRALYLRARFTRAILVEQGFGAPPDG